MMLYILGHLVLECYQALGDSLFFIYQLVKQFYFLNHTFPDICQRILGMGKGLFIIKLLLHTDEGLSTSKNDKRSPLHFETTVLLVGIPPCEEKS